MAYRGTPISTVRGPARTWSDTFSMAFWVKLDGAPSTARYAYLASGTGSTGTAWIVIDHLDFNTIGKFLFYGGAGNYYSVTYGVLSAGTWYHLVMRRYNLIGTGWVIDGYINGSYTGGASAPTHDAPAAHRFEIRGVHGAVCDAVLWNTQVNLSFNAITTNRISASLQHTQSIVDYIPGILESTYNRGDGAIITAGTNLGYDAHPIRILGR